MSELEIPNVDEAGSSFLASCSSITYIQLNFLKILQESSFAYCRNLQKAILPSAIEIKASSFSFCESLQVIDFPEAQTISKSAFNDCMVLKSVYLPKVTSIEESAFENCISLTYVHLPMLTTVPNDAIRIFYRCIKLEQINLPSTPPYEFSETAFASTGINVSSKDSAIGIPITICLPRTNDYKNNYWVDNEAHKTTSNLWKGVLAYAPNDFMNVCSDIAEEDNSLSEEVIIGIVCGGVAFVALVVVSIICCRRWKKRRDELNIQRKTLLITSAIIDDFD